ncbi:MAG: putative nucleic acid-binding Zn-ribbon protein [Planctomycetota bacterium]|jgi:predicted  nucleic acid-binding Zn-ribbon protein
MGHQDYLRKLHARINHLDVALDRARDLRAEHPVRRPLEALREHATKIESDSAKWEDHREAVETTLHHLQDEIEADESALGQMAESVRDGAVELFRGEPSELVRRTEAVLKKLKES